MNPSRCAIVLSLVLVPLLTVSADEAALEDPVPIRRVLIPAARVAAELERVAQGVLVPVPREEFEALVQKAARAGVTRRSRPHMVRASYKAVLQQDALTGSGAWTVFNPGAKPGILPLPDLNLALSKIKTEADYRDAVIGELEGATQGVLVEKSGAQKIHFDWSLRGTPAANALHFAARLPACAATTLELRVPSDQVVALTSPSFPSRPPEGGRRASGETPPAGVTLSGPHDSENPGMRLWQLHCAGRGQLDFAIRRRSAPDIAALLLTSLQSRQQLAPGRCEAVFEFQIDVLHAAIDDMVFDCDPGLEPYEVTLKPANSLPRDDRGKAERLDPDVKSWQVQETAAPGDKKVHPAGKVLVVRMREPVQGAIRGLQVRCLAFPADGLWTSPVLRLRKAFVRSETLRLNIHPDVRLQKWDGGQFRLVETKSESDGSQTIMAIGAGPQPALRPKGLLTSQGVEWVAQQHTWWQIGDKGMTLTAEIAPEVQRGNLFQMSLGLPTAGSWQVDEVTLNGKEVPGTWRRAGNMLQIDFTRPLGSERPGKAGTLGIRLRAPWGSNRPRAALTMDFPELAILDPCTRTGTLAISADPIYQAAVVQSSTPPSMPTTAPEGGGPWGKSLPGYFFPLRNQPITGKLRLVPYPSRVNARCSTEVALAPGSAAVHARLEIEPVLGTPQAVDLYLSAPPQSRWQWKAQDNLVRGMEHVPVMEAMPHLLRFGLHDPWTLLGIQAALPPGQRWRLLLERPLERGEILTLETSLETDGDSKDSWEIPLVSVLGAEHTEGQVSIRLGGVELAQVIAAGLHEAGLGELAPTAITGRQQPVWRIFQYGTDMPFPRLRVMGRAVSAIAPAREMCDRGELTTYLETEGRLLHHFRFQVWNWRERDLKLLLPASTTQVLGARTDDRWITMISREQAPEGIEVRLPVPTDERLHRFEIVYSSETRGMSWPAWGHLFAPAPQLPLPPSLFRRTWRLPPGLMPLRQSAFQARSGPPRPEHDQPLLDSIRRTWHAGDALLTAAGVRLSRDWSGAQRQQVTQAEAAWRRKPTRERQLGSALERLFENLPEQPVLIDTVALQAAGLRPGTKLAAAKRTAPGQDATPFWESVDLVYVPCQHGPLFTARRERDKWQSGQSASFAEVFASALAEAAAFGQDASGRFRALDVWLRSGNDATPPSPFRAIADSFSGWTEWEPGAANANPERMTVVNGKSAALAGLALALFLCLLAWRIGGRLSRRWSFRLLLAWLALAGLGLLWAPVSLRQALSSVFVAAVLVFLVWYIRAVTRRLEHAPGGKPSSGRILRPSVTLTAGLLLVTGLLSAPVSSGSPEPVTVYLLAGRGGVAERQTALVPPNLMKRLNELAGGATPALNQAVLLAARYKGVVRGMNADFKAELDFYSFAEQAILPISLEGIDLKDETFLDGKPLAPLAATPPQTGYLVPVGDGEEKSGKGFHRLELSFSVRITPGLKEQELRFVIPLLAQTQLDLNMPPDLYGVQVVTAAGEQRLIRTSKQAQLVSAALGRASVVHVRWRQNKSVVPAARLGVRELYYWDLRQPAPSLTGILQFSVLSGEVSTLTLALPEGLEVRTVDVVPADAFSVNAARLKSWRLHEAKDKRLLQTELLRPIAGDFHLKLGLVPRLAIAPGNVVLPLPLPLNIKTEGFGEGKLAYRLEGLEARESPQNLAVVVVSGELFSKAWRAVDPRALGQPTRAFSFSRNSPNAALNLNLTAPAPLVSQALHWQVHPFHADLGATCELEANADELMLIEWHVPPAVVVTAVSGPHVRSWSRSDSLLQVWLTEPQKETSVTLSGWIKHVQPLINVGHFELPDVYVRRPSAATTFLQIRGAPGVAVELERLQNLIRSPDREIPGLLAFVTQQPQNAPYGGSFRLSPLPVKPQVDSLTLVKTQNRLLTFTTAVNCTIPFGELRQLVVELRRWPGTDVKITARRIMLQTAREPMKNGHRWLLNFPAGVTRQFSFELSGQMPLPPGTKASLPDVIVRGAERLKRYLAVSGQDLEIDPVKSLQPVKNVGADLVRWPDEAKQISRSAAAWQITGDDWQARLSPRLAAGAPPFRVLLAEQEAALGDRGHWIHQAHFLIFAQRGADLQMMLPGGARLLAVALDDIPVTSQRPAPNQCLLPLAGPAGPHRLSLRWSYDTGETLEQPMLAAPAIMGVTGVPVTCMIRVPPGYDANLPPAPIELVYRRAQAYLQMSKLLGEQSMAGTLSPAGLEILQTQQRFFWYCRQSERLAAKTENSTSWLEKVKALRRQNADYSRELGYEKSGTEAEDKTPVPDTVASDLFSLPGDGRPLYWVQDPGARPILVLASRAVEQIEQSLFASEVLLLVLVAFGAVSYFPRISGRLGSLWPEQLMLLACIGWYLLGGSLVGILLAATGVSARAILLGAWVQRLFRRGAPVRPGSSYLPGS
jgi:hypothetical protein